MKFIVLLTLTALAACSDAYTPENAAPVIGNSLRSWCKFQTDCTVESPDKTSSTLVP